MAKYEIMLILDPREELKVAENMINEVFKNAKVTKLDRTELAYEINKSKTATYLLIEVEANGAEVKEFTRRVNIAKTFWRLLVVNLDSEMGREEALAKIAARKEKLAQERAEAAKAREAEGR